MPAIVVSQVPEARPGAPGAVPSPVRVLGHPLVEVRELLPSGPGASVRDPSDESQIVESRI